MTSTPDYAHTRTADENRKVKAHALAVAAAELGVQPYELRVLGGGTEHAANRREVRRAAGVDRDPSVETWQMTVGMLEHLGRKVPGSGPCPACGYPTLEVRVAGRRLLVDPFPHPLGTVWLADEPGQPARILAGHDERPDDVDLYRQHAASCPESLAVARRTAPRCTVCAQPLNAALAAQDPSYTTHPCCDPREEVRPP